MVLRLNGYGAWIESEDKPLAEHAVEVKDDDIYICSEEGKEFILHFDDDGSHLTTPSTPYGRSLKITIDGLGVDNLWSDPRRKQSSHEVSVGDTVRPYVLAPIDTTDDDVAARDDPNIEHLGTVHVELRRAVCAGPGTVAYQGTVPSTGPIHEKSKKAGSHRVA